MRKIIQISSAVTAEGLFLHALCDDGTVWINDSATSQGRWSRVPPIPQDEPPARPSEPKNAQLT
jgi:hypothetical protein